MLVSGGLGLNKKEFASRVEIRVCWFGHMERMHEPAHGEKYVEGGCNWTTADIGIPRPGLINDERAERQCAKDRKKWRALVNL